MTETIAPKKKSTAFYIKRTIGLILLLAMAAVFSYSAYTKIGTGEGVDPFAWTFIDTVSYYTSPSPRDCS